MSMLDHPVRSLIRRPMVTVDPGTTLREVARVLTDELIGLVVVHGARPPGATGTTVAGVVSERDIVAATAEHVRLDERVDDVMTVEIATIDARDSVADAIHAVLANEIRHLVVTDHGLAVGVVSARDLLLAMHDQLGRDVCSCPGS